MTSTTNSRQAVAGAYLDALDRALAELPPSRRREIVNDIAEHIDNDPGRDIHDVLRRLGDPLAIAGEALRDEPGFVSWQQHAKSTPPTPAPGNGLEIATIVLLAAGGFLFVVGWLVGAALLWASPRWSGKDKLCGTLLVPGGFVSVLFLLVSGVGGYVTSTDCDGAGHCVTTGGPSTIDTVGSFVLLAVLVLGPAYTTFRLSRRLIRSQRQPA